MRSGSSELSADLALNSRASHGASAPPRLSNLGEPFNFGGGVGDPRKRDPIASLSGRIHRENVTTPSIVFKLFPAHLGDAALASVLRSAAACVVVLERNATARACSLEYSRTTADWSGHERRPGRSRGGAAPAAAGATGGDGARWHPPCAPIGSVSRAEESQRRRAVQAQGEWFSLVRRTLGVGRGPSWQSGRASWLWSTPPRRHLWLSLENISRRSAAADGRRGVLNEVYRFCGLPQIPSDDVVRKARTYR